MMVIGRGIEDRPHPNRDTEERDDMLRKITATLMALAVAGGGALMTATFGAVKAPGRSRSPAHADAQDDNVRPESPDRPADRRQA